MDCISVQVLGSCVQRRYSPHTRTYLGPGKIVDVMAAVNATNARTLVIDDDLTAKQQRNLEEALSANGGVDVKVLNYTASHRLQLSDLSISYLYSTI